MTQDARRETPYVHIVPCQACSNTFCSLTDFIHPQFLTMSGSALRSIASTLLSAKEVCACFLFGSNMHLTGFVMHASGIDRGSEAARERERRRQALSRATHPDGQPERPRATSRSQSAIKEFATCMSSFAWHSSCERLMPSRALSATTDSYRFFSDYLETFHLDERGEFSLSSFLRFLFLF